MKKEKLKINVKDRLDDNVLDLSMSEIEQIPVKEIAELRRATSVDLSSNNIKFLPKNFGLTLVRITRLDLSKNQLKFLTEDFCNLVNLKHLDLYNNQLESLPVSFGKLSKLRYLDLKGNPLQPALQKIVGPCLTSKDCLDAAKNIVPFMSELEMKVKAEQAKREEENRKRAEEEELAAREQARLAKKAARKERVMRERLEKAESEKILPNETNESNESERYLETKQKSPTSIFRTFTKVLILLFLIISLALVTFLPKNQKIYYNSFLKVSDEVSLHLLDSKASLTSSESFKYPSTVHYACTKQKRV